MRQSYKAVSVTFRKGRNELTCSLVEGEIGSSRSGQLEDKMNTRNSPMGVQRMMVRGKPDCLEVAFPILMSVWRFIAVFR